jgi:hypothetical protein
MSSRNFASVALAVVALLLALTAFTTVITPSVVVGANATSATITQTSSGLVASDSLTTGNTSYWKFGGDAAAEGAPHTYAENSSGLYIGVQSALAGQWAGFYAESPNTNASLFHALITLPYSTIPDNYLDTGLYVQTSDNLLINYVACVAVVSASGYYWAVVQATGLVTGGDTIQNLWTSAMNALPRTEDCSIITNGNNYLKVYLGGTVVYQSSSLILTMPLPFNTYLEVQTNSASALRWGSYLSYYATQSENVTVTNAPAGGTVKIVDSSNNLLASSYVSSTGTAILPVGNYRLPLTASIGAYNSTGNLVASTLSTVTIWGGDVYAVSSSTPTSGIALIYTQSTSGTMLSPPFQFTISNFNAGTGDNRLIVVGISANSENAVSVTFDNASFTQAVISFHENDAEFWYLEQPFPAGTGNIVVTMEGPTSAVIGAYAFSGVAQGIPIATKATNYSTVASSPTISITTKDPNSWVLDLPSIYGDVTLGSPTCTEQWDANVPNAITGASSSLVTSSPGQYSCGWAASGGGDLWDDVAIEVQPATTSPGITVDAHRIPASYWDACFATWCSAGTGPGVSMYIELLNSSGVVIQTGFANEYGYRFTGLNPNVTYYVYPTNCYSCNGAMHDVVFQYWGNGSTTRPIAVTVGTTLDAWYSCTNECLGGP